MPAFHGIKCATCDARVERMHESPTVEPLDPKRDPTFGWITLAPATLAVHVTGRCFPMPLAASAAREYLCPKCAQVIPLPVRMRLAVPFPGVGVADDDYSLGA